MPATDFRSAIRTALDEELEQDPRVVFFGEDVAAPGGVFATSTGLYDKYGGRRVFDTPISELALAGTAFGSAVCGLRPVIEIMFGDFLLLTLDSLINQSTKFFYLSNEQAPVPLVVRSAVGAGGRFGAIHSQNPIPWVHQVPGLKILAPSTPSDAKALLKASIRDDNPVLFLEHKRLYGLKTDAELGDEVGVIGEAAVRRPGEDLTLISVMKGVHDCLAAADLLAADGISTEVIDLRTVRPWDRLTVFESVARTRRLAVVDEAPAAGGWAGQVIAEVAEHRLGELDALWAISTPSHPIPYSPPLEDAFLPSAERIASEVRSHLKTA